jgi:DNA polymerase III subunit delta
MIVFLYGEDSFRSRQKLNEIKEKYAKSDKSGSGLSSFDVLDEKNITQKIKDAFGMANLLAPKRLVVVENLISIGSESEQKEALDYVKKNIDKILSDNDLVAVFWEREMPKKNNSLFKFLDKSAKSQNFEKLNGTKINQWILVRMKMFDERAGISKTALEKLIVYTGNDSRVLDNEMQKLASFTEGRMITDDDVELLVRSNIDSNIFQFIDALGANKKKEALGLLHGHLEKGDDPFYLMTMFVYQFRNMLKVADLVDRGVRNEYEISKIAKLHPFVVKKSLGQIRNFSFEKLKSIYDKLCDMDSLVKTGKIDIRLALDKFVAEI